VRSAEERGYGGEVGGAGDEAEIAGRDGDAGGGEHREVGFRDVARAVVGGTDERGMGVKTGEVAADVFEMKDVADGGAGESGENRGLRGVIEIEDVGETRPAKGAEKLGPGTEAVGQGDGAGDVGVEREDGGVGGLGEDADAGVGPVEAEVAQEGTEQDDVAEVTAADDEEMRNGRHAGFRVARVRTRR